MLSAERNDRESPLLCLPAELRNRIHEYVLTDGIYTFLIYYGVNRPSIHVLRRPAGLTIISTCLKLYHETRLLPFIQNEFDCEGVEIFIELHACLNTWQRSALKHASFSIDMVGPIEDSRGLKALTSMLDSQWNRVFFGDMFLNAQHVWLDDPWTRGFELCGLKAKAALENWLRRRSDPRLQIVYLS